MVSIVQQLEVARDFFARAPWRGALTEVARHQSISRPAVYRIIERATDAFGHGGPLKEIHRLRTLLEETQERLRDAHQKIDDLSRPREPDWTQIHRFIVQAAVCPVSLRDNAGLVREAFKVDASHEYVRGIVDAASVRARKVQEDLAPEKKARQAVGDEIFLGDHPLLVVADPASLAVLRLSVEEHRDEKTWATLLAPLGKLETFASDLGKGMTAAVEARGWPHQADVFHALKILSESVAVEERRCYQAIAQEYAWERRLQKLQEAGDDSRGVATHYALAKKKAQRALERFGEIEGLLRPMRQAIDLCDETGRWMTPEERERRLCPAIDRLDPLGMARRRRVAGYWRNPKLLTFAREIQRRLEAIEVPSGPLDRRELIDAATGAWALAQGRLRGPEALTAQLRALAAARAYPEFFPSLRSQVAAILDDALRASSAIETLNSLWRVYQQVKKTFSTDFAYLVALAHNTHEFTEGPRRGHTPFELLGVDVGPKDWLSLVV